MPKDQFDPGLNDLADEIKTDVTGIVEDFKKDYNVLKQDYIGIKNEITPIYHDIKNYLDKRKASRQLRNIITFGQNVRNLRRQNA